MSLEEESERKSGVNSPVGGLNSASGVDADADVLQRAETVDVVRFSVPPYTGKLQTWFMRLEAQFRAARVVSQSVRFNIVIAQAPDSVSDSLTEEEIIAMAHRKKCYDELKQLLLRRCTPSEDERFTTLLKGASIPSSDRPSDIFRAISREAKGLLPQEAIKKIWMLKLPVVIQMMLLKEDQLGMSELIEVADRYHEKGKHGDNGFSVDAVRATNPFLDFGSSVPPSTSTKASSCASSSTEDPIAGLTRMMQELKAEVCALRREGSRETPRKPVRARQRSATPARRRDQDTRRLCWYHDKFGSRAKDCKQPCDWQAGN